MEKTPEVLLKTRRFSVVRQTVRTRRGTEVAREWVEHPGAVVILPLVSDDQVCLIRNFRIAVGKTLWELPAGTLEGEDPAVTAERELAEETGYRCSSLEKIHEFYMSPGILNERMHLFVARGLTAGPTALEENEEIETHLMAWDEALHLADTGMIEDAKTLVGLYAYDRLRRRPR